MQPFECYVYAAANVNVEALSFLSIEPRGRIQCVCLAKRIGNGSSSCYPKCTSLAYMRPMEILG